MRLAKKPLTLLFILPAIAQGFTPGVSEQLFPSKTYINPYNKRAQSDFRHMVRHTGAGFSLDRANNFARQIRAYLRQKIQNDAVEVQQSRLNATAKDSRFGFGRFLLSDRSPMIFDQRFYFGGQPICNYQLKAQRSKSGTVWMLGLIPELPADLPALQLSDWPAKEDSKDRIKNSFPDAKTLHFFEAKSCVFILSGEAKPVWQWVVEKNNLPYQVTADSQSIYENMPLYLDANFDIQVFDPNILAGPSKVVQTPLKSGSQLSNDFFELINVGGNTAAAGSNGFVGYSESDPVLEETSAFYHANVQLQFFKNLGYAWSSEAPLHIRVHDNEIAGENNALYRYSSLLDHGLPAISIGDGDGITLQNLATDRSVVEHEFGHHTIFRALTSTQGESLILHEALADFFAFSSANDPCLGRSICPAGSDICYVKGQCLRTALNDLKYNSLEWKSMGAHQRGQVISGMLWDVRSTIGPDALTSLVFHAIDRLQGNSGLIDFFIALLFEDEDRFDQKFGKILYDAMIARGFGPLIHNSHGVNIDYQDPSTWVDTTQDTLASEENLVLQGPTPPPKKTPFCGAIGGASGSQEASALPLLIAPWIFAMLKVFWQKRRKILKILDLLSR